MNPVGTAVPAWHSTYRPLKETGAAEDLVQHCSRLKCKITHPIATQLARR